MTSAPVLPRAPEAEFGHGLRTALELVRNAAVAERLPEPISPELVLVCPELRALALDELPERDPDAFAPVRARMAAQVVTYARHISDIDNLEIQPPHVPAHAKAGAFLAIEAAQVAVVCAAAMGALAGAITLGTLLV